MKFVKVFSLKSFPLYGMYGVVTSQIGPGMRTTHFGREQEVLGSFRSGGCSHDEIKHTTLVHWVHPLQNWSTEFSLSATNNKN